MTDVLTPITIEGLPATDKAYRLGDGRYRVRVALADSVAPTVPLGDGSQIAPTVLRFDISVTQLDDDDQAVRDAAGKVILVGQTGWTLDDEARSVPGFDAETTLLGLIQGLCSTAEARRVTDAATREYLATWGAE